LINNNFHLEKIQKIAIFLFCSVQNENLINNQDYQILKQEEHNFLMLHNVKDYLLIAFLIVFHEFSKG